MARDGKILIGISSCLLGEKVRFDGNHKLDNAIRTGLGEVFDFQPVCPEVGIGLGVPRPPIRLVGEPGVARAVGVKDSGLDVTEDLIRFAHKISKQLTSISGYIFKKGSPSCGLLNVKIYKSNTQVLNTGTGLFAKEIIKAHPLLPVEEEGRLNDPLLRDNFLQRVEIYHHWQQLVTTGIRKKSLLDFHTRHKYTLLAHCEVTYRTLGQLLARAGKMDLQVLSDQYISAFMEGLKKPTTRGKQANVLEHLAGYFKHYLDGHDKSEFRQLITAYRLGEMPREALLVMLKHYLRKFPNDYLQLQHYLHQGSMAS